VITGSSDKGRGSCTRFTIRTGPEAPFEMRGRDGGLFCICPISASVDPTMRKFVAGPCGGTTAISISASSNGPLPERAAGSARCKREGRLGWGHRYGSATPCCSSCIRPRHGDAARTWRACDTSPGLTRSSVPAHEHEGAVLCGAHAKALGR